MTIDGFVKKLLPPTPLEVGTAQPVKKKDVDTACDAIEMYLTFGICARAYLIEGKVILVPARWGRMIH